MRTMAMMVDMSYVPKWVLSFLHNYQNR